MSNIPPADFSAMIPGGVRDETVTDPAAAREPVPQAPLVTQIPAYDPAKSLADQIAEVLGEPAAQRDPDATTVTTTEFPSQTPAGQQDDTSPASPAAPSPTPGEGEGGSDAVSGSSAAPPDPASTSPDDPTHADPISPPDPDDLTREERVSLDALAENLYGRPPTRDESVAIMQLWEDIARLSPEQKMQVARAMGYVNDDTSPTTTPTTHQPPAPSTPQTPDDDVDPYLAPHLQPLQHDLTELRSQVQSLVSDRQLSESQRMEQEANAALESFRDQYAELTPEEHAALQLRIRNSGVVAANYQQTGDITDSITKALEYEMYRDEQLRSKVLTARQEQATTQDTQRQHRAASLSPGGAQVPREDTTPTPPRVMDRMEARRAMTEELKPLFNQQ